MFVYSLDILRKILILVQLLISFQFYYFLILLIVMIHKYYNKHQKGFFHFVIFFCFNQQLILFSGFFPISHPLLPLQPFFKPFQTLVQAYDKGFTLCFSRLTLAFPFFHYH